MATKIYIDIKQPAGNENTKFMKLSDLIQRSLFAATQNDNWAKDWEIAQPFFCANLIYELGEPLLYSNQFEIELRPETLDNGNIQYISYLHGISVIPDYSCDIEIMDWCPCNQNCEGFEAIKHLAIMFAESLLKIVKDNQDCFL